MKTSAREARLVLLARAGDRESLEQLLTAVQAALRGYIAGRVGRTAADDVLQETLLQICRNLLWLRDPELFYPWAYRIASRACFRELKRSGRLVTGSEDSLSGEDVPSVSQKELVLFTELPELFERVAPSARAVLSLHYLYDLTLQDIAAILEIGVGTVKSRLAYGLARLREILTEKEKEGDRI